MPESIHPSPNDEPSQPPEDLPDKEADETSKEQRRAELDKLYEAYEADVRDSFGFDENWNMIVDPNYGEEERLKKERNRAELDNLRYFDGELIAPGASTDQSTDQATANSPDGPDDEAPKPGSD